MITFLKIFAFGVQIFCQMIVTHGAFTDFVPDSMACRDVRDRLTRGYCFNTLHTDFPNAWDLDPSYEKNKAFWDQAEACQRIGDRGSRGICFNTIYEDYTPSFNIQPQETCHEKDIEKDCWSSEGGTEYKFQRRGPVPISLCPRCCYQTNNGEICEGSTNNVQVQKKCHEKDINKVCWQVDDGIEYPLPTNVWVPIGLCPKCCYENGVCEGSTKSIPNQQTQNANNGNQQIQNTNNGNQQTQSSSDGKTDCEREEERIRREGGAFLFLADVLGGLKIHCKDKN